MRALIAAALVAVAATDELLELELGAGQATRRHLQARPEPEPPVGGLSPHGPPSPPHPPGTPPLPPLVSSDVSTGGCAAAFGSRPTIATVDAPAGAFVTPRAMAFNPARPGELWVADSGRDAASVVELSAGGASAGGAISARAVRVVKDRAQYHYMDQVSSIAFDPIGQFATCQER